MADANKKSKRIGLIGLIIAENAREQFALDRVVFIPTGLAPHKSGPQILPKEHRCSMIEAAIRDNTHFFMSRMEVDANEICYTYRTLEILTEEHPDTEFFFILGGDSLKYFDHWNNPQRISDLATIIVGARDEIEAYNLAECILNLETRYDTRIEVINCPAFDISSELIRSRIAAGQSIRYFLPDAVVDYIKEHHLYEYHA